MDYSDLKDVLAEAYTQRDGSGKTPFPPDRLPFQLGSCTIPVGARIHFPPITNTVYFVAGRKSNRTARFANIFFGDDGGSCINVFPGEGDSITVVVKLRTRNLPASMQVDAV